MSLNHLNKEIEFSELKNLENFFLLDVREEWEFEDFNIGGQNIPLPLLPEKLNLLTEHNIIVCCCSYGGKSKIAVKLISDQFPEKFVFNIKEGIEIA